MIPGAGGAAAAGIFGIARKIASIPLIVRQSFLYVLAPLASAQAALDRREIAPLYSFSTHVSLLLAAPLAGFLILVAADMLSDAPPKEKPNVKTNLSQNLTMMNLDTFLTYSKLFCINTFSLQFSLDTNNELTIVGDKISYDYFIDFMKYIQFGTACANYPAWPE
jgi:hypothetical protein